MARQKDTVFNSGTLVNYYKVLGLENYASLSEVRKAYRGLVKTTHPDVVAPELREEATEIFKSVLLAYTILNHPGKKQYYDEQLQSVIDAVKQRVSTHQAKTKKAASKEGGKERHPHTSPSKTTHGEKAVQVSNPKHRNTHHTGKNHPSKPLETSEPFIAVPSKPMFWKKWYTLYVVESKPNTWHATWEPTAKQRQQAAQKGVLFKCVNYYTGTILQHVQVPFGVIPDHSNACVLKLAINNSILLNLQVEKVNPSGISWFSVGDSPKPNRPPQVQTSTEDDDLSNETNTEGEDLIEQDREEDCANAVEGQDSTVSSFQHKSPNEEGAKQANSFVSKQASSQTRRTSSSASAKSTVEKTTAQPPELPLMLEVWEAVLGTEKDVLLPQQGTQEQSLGHISIPAGIKPNQLLRITHHNETYLLRVSILIPTQLSEEVRNCYELLQHISTTENQGF
jgi:curved DNA-binding protein CbpA